jgi:dienelactone hydrolase
VSPRPSFRRAGPLLRALQITLAVWLALSPGLFASQRVSFRTDDGVTIAATWYEPANRTGPAVILVHMLHRTRRDFDALGSRLAAEGIGALALDLRGHGESGGAPGADFVPMAADVKAARHFLSSRSDVTGRIGILGASLGGTLGAIAAADDPTIATLVMLSPSLDYRGLRIENAMRKFGARPLLMVASDDDAYATRSAKDIQKGGKTREILSLSGAGHGTNMLEHDPSLMGSLVDWFRRTLL